MKNVNGVNKVVVVVVSTRRALEKSELPWDKIFYSCGRGSCRTISLSSFNILCCKLIIYVLNIILA